MALNDQWYLPYGDEEWVGRVSGHVNSENFKAYSQVSYIHTYVRLDWVDHGVHHRPLASLTLAAFTTTGERADRKRRSRFGVV